MIWFEVVHYPLEVWHPAASSSGFLSLANFSPHMDYILTEERPRRGVFRESCVFGLCKEILLNHEVQFENGYLETAYEPKRGFVD